MTVEGNNTTDDEKSTVSSSSSREYILRIKKETDRVRQKKEKHNQITVTLQRSQQEPQQRKKPKNHHQERIINKARVAPRRLSGSYNKLDTSVRSNTTSSITVSNNSGSNSNNSRENLDKPITTSHSTTKESKSHTSTSSQRSKNNGNNNSNNSNRKSFNNSTINSGHRTTHRKNPSSNTVSTNINNFSTSNPVVKSIPVSYESKPQKVVPVRSKKVHSTGTTQRKNLSNSKSATESGSVPTSYKSVRSNININDSRSNIQKGYSNINLKLIPASRESNPEKVSRPSNEGYRTHHQKRNSHINSISTQKGLSNSNSEKDSRSNNEGYRTVQRKSSNNKSTSTKSSSATNGLSRSRKPTMSLNNDTNGKFTEQASSPTPVTMVSANDMEQPIEAGIFLNSDIETNEDGVVMPVDVTKPSSSSSSSRKWWLIVLLCVSIVALVIILPCYFLIIAPSSSSSGSSGFTKISSENSNAVVGGMPEDICHELFPGEGTCTPIESEDTRQGGELCNLVAKSMINTTVGADIAFINSGVCESSLFKPELKVGDIINAIAANELVVVDISGVDLVNILTEAVSSSFSEDLSSNPGSYPYASGLRYTVEANLIPSEMVSKVEVNRGLRDDTWEPIDVRRYYKVITTAPLADGEMGYSSFTNVIDSWKNSLDIETVDAFYNHVKKNEEDWWNLPDSEYSTQFFIGENVEPTFAVVPTRICHALVPGEPVSEFCTAADVVHGDDVCNLVAWGLYDRVFGVDLVLLKGDTCAADIEDGNMGESDVDQALSSDQALVTITVPGSVIKPLVEGAISAVVDNGTKGEYPYFAGLRFDVDTNSPTGSRVSNLEVKTQSGSWVPIDDTNSYTMLTTANMVQSNNPSYSSISLAGASTNTGMTMKDEFMTYAKEWGFLYPLAEEKSSTQSYV